MHKKRQKPKNLKAALSNLLWGSTTSTPAA